MGYMKSLFTGLQERGWKDEDIRKIPNKVAWEMAANEEKEMRKMDAQDIMAEKNKSEL